MIANSYVEIIEKILIKCLDEKNCGPGFAWKHKGGIRTISEKVIGLWEVR
jgi:hypothetical protein